MLTIISLSHRALAITALLGVFEMRGSQCTNQIFVFLKARVTILTEIAGTQLELKVELHFVHGTAKDGIQETFLLVTFNNL